MTSRTPASGDRPQVLETVDPDEISAQWVGERPKIDGAVVEAVGRAADKLIRRIYDQKTVHRTQHAAFLTLGMYSHFDDIQEGTERVGSSLEPVFLVVRAMPFPTERALARCRQDLTLSPLASTAHAHGWLGSVYRPGAPLHIPSHPIPSHLIPSHPQSLAVRVCPVPGPSFSRFERLLAPLASLRRFRAARRIGSRRRSRTVGLGFSTASLLPASSAFA